MQLDYHTVAGILHDSNNDQHMEQHVPYSVLGLLFTLSCVIR